MKELERYQKAAKRFNKIKLGFYLKRKQLVKAEKEYIEAQEAYEKSKLKNCYDV